jgi:hypothetical protein
VIGGCHRRHRSIEFRKFLDTIDQNVAEYLDVHLILDNKTALIRNGWSNSPGSTFISHQRALPGSTWSSAGLPLLLKSRSAVAFIAACAN